ncbi:MAG: LptF/LptG family permease [Robiginitomaculum sp.]|nr:LptF/LptG family permease [Robiginitomaculum sp.]
MKLIQKYFLRQARTPLLLSLSALSVLALLTQSLSTLDLITQNRQSALTFMYITVLALPQLFSIIMPLAVFMAMLYALNRLNMDSELVVTKASGFSPWQIASPALRIASYALVVHLLINLFVQPYTFRLMRAALLDVRTDVASRMVRAGEFTTPAPGLTLYASEILPTGLMRDVLIYDARSSEAPLTYSAREGQVNSSLDGKTHFTLYNGSVSFLKDTGSMDITDFEKTTYDLTEILAVDPVLRLKTSDRYLHELFVPDPADYAVIRFKKEYLAEGHSRLATPLYNYALVLLALAFLIRGEHQKMGYARRLAIAGALGFTLRLGGFAIASAAEKDTAMNAAQYALPILISAVAIWYLLYTKSAKTIFPPSFRHVFQRGKSKPDLPANMETSA